MNNKQKIDKIIDNIIIDIDDLNNDGKYNIDDFLQLNSNKILKQNGDKKFDICIFNPALKQRPNKYLNFISNHRDLSNKTIFMMQIRWLQKHRQNSRTSQQYRKELNGYVKSIEEIPEKEIYSIYKDSVMVGEAGILVCSNDETSKLDLLTYGSSKVELSLCKKISGQFGRLSKKYPELNDFINILKYAKTFEDIKEKYFVPVYQWNVKDNFYDSLIMPIDKAKNYKKDIKYLVFNSEEEINNFKNSLKTKFMEYYFENIIIPNDGKFINCMFLLKDYSKPVTNETFYKIFNLTEEEINIIKNFKPNEKN